MGEYARFRGEEVKIGTCEDMYYLRADQRFSVAYVPGNVQPSTVGLRYRFPWPDEDMIQPGSDRFHDNGYHRSIFVPGYAAPANVEHSNVQFVAQAGYLISLPCPEGLPDSTPGLTATRDYKGHTIHRNGFSGAVHLVSQKLMEDGRLVPVLRCGGCGAMWRVEIAGDIEALAVALRSEGDTKARRGTARDGEFWHTVADRVLAGAKLNQGQPVSSV